MVCRVSRDQDGRGWAVIDRSRLYRVPQDRTRMVYRVSRDQDGRGWAVIGRSRLYRVPQD